MKIHKMEVIPKSEKSPGAVLFTREKGPYTIIHGRGAVNCYCGTCGNIICKYVEPVQLMGLFFEIAEKGSFCCFSGQIYVQFASG